MIILKSILWFKEKKIIQKQKWIAFLKSIAPWAAGFFKDCTFADRGLWLTTGFYLFILFSHCFKTIDMHLLLFFSLFQKQQRALYISVWHKKIFIIEQLKWATTWLYLDTTKMKAFTYYLVFQKPKPVNRGIWNRNRNFKNRDGFLITGPGSHLPIMGFVNLQALVHCWFLHFQNWSFSYGKCFYTFECVYCMCKLTKA